MELSLGDALGTLGQPAKDSEPLEGATEMLQIERGCICTPTYYTDFFGCGSAALRSSAAKFLPVYQSFVA